MAWIPTSSHPKIQRVPALILEEEETTSDYYPKVVSIGPYHHGEPKLASVEAFKPIAVDLFISGGQQNKEFYYKYILEAIGEIRQYYEPKSTANYSDAALAQMMFRDASFIVINMEIFAPSATQMITRSRQWHIYSTLMAHLGRLTLAYFYRDFSYLLENQIPLHVIKLLINLRYGAGEDDKLIDGIIINVAEPLHLLEAFHRQVILDCVEQEKTSCGCFKYCIELRVEEDQTGSPQPPQTCSICRYLCCSGVKQETTSFHSFRTVTDLKAKGIHFKPSPTQSLKDVNFKSRFFYATLELPVWYVSIYTKVFFKNMVAYELTLNSPASAEVTSYISFMKSLIDRPEDVKELRERRIFYNQLGSDEEVLNVYRNINTYGAEEPLFEKVKDKIQAHYNSRSKTWMAELGHTNFRSPWTTTAFVAAAGLLAITAAQLYYAVHPNT
ncbi:hypothetical protein C2S52_021058 [Perilla frutescens var. hirtella]|nr:hypothetical protein C2S52_021058 [Perilla frutescens var. hirtella]